MQATIVEIFGIDCIDNDFVDRQLQWIKSWEEQVCAEERLSLLIKEKPKKYTIKNTSRFYGCEPSCKFWRF